MDIHWTTTTQATSLEHPLPRGVREQYARARMFLQEALGSFDPLDRFRRLIAAVYFARSIVEIMLDAAEGGWLKAFNKPDAKQNRKDLEAQIAPNFSRYALVEKIRIHDFHRSGLTPEDGPVLCGPIKAMPSKGEVVIEIPVAPAGGRVVSVTGKSRVQEQRPLQSFGAQFFDEESNAFLGLEQILTDYLAAAPAVIADFEKMLTA